MTRDIRRGREGGREGERRRWRQDGDRKRRMRARHRITRRCGAAKPTEAAELLRRCCVVLARVLASAPPRCHAAAPPRRRAAAPPARTSATTASDSATRARTAAATRGRRRRASVPSTRASSSTTLPMQARARARRRHGPLRPRTAPRPRVRQVLRAAKGRARAGGRRVHQGSRSSLNLPTTASLHHTHAAALPDHLLHAAAAQRLRDLLAAAHA